MVSKEVQAYVASLPGPRPANTRVPRGEHGLHSLRKPTKVERMTWRVQQMAARRAFFKLSPEAQRKLSAIVRANRTGNAVKDEYAATPARDMSGSAVSGQRLSALLAASGLDLDAEW